MARSSRAPAPELTAQHRFIVLHGKDDFQLRERLKRFADLLRDAHGDIEQFEFDGASCTLAEVLDELRSFGLMQEHKLVVVDNADQFLSAGEGKSANRAALERYAAAPVEHATLVLRAMTWRPGKLDKAVDAVVKCEPPNDRQAVSWCIERCGRRHDATLERDAAQLLVERIGAHLMRLDQELGKLAAHAGSGATITRALVGEMVGLSREEQAWEVQSAILSGDPETALVRLRELLDVSQLPEILVSWAVGDLVRKLHAASRMLAEGEPSALVAKTLKLWGPSRDVIMHHAQRLDPNELAKLMGQAVQLDAKTKTGLADPGRALEGLTALATEAVG